MKAIVVTDQAAGTAGMKLVERPERQGRRSPAGYSSYFRYTGWLRPGGKLVEPPAGAARLNA